MAPSARMPPQRRRTSRIVVTTHCTSNDLDDSIAVQISKPSSLWVRSITTLHVAGLEASRSNGAPICGRRREGTHSSDPTPAAPYSKEGSGPREAAADIDLLRQETSGRPEPRMMASRNEVEQVALRIDLLVRTKLRGPCAPAVRNRKMAASDR